MITVSNASFRYPGTARPALRNLSVRFSAGESVAVMGSNGSGKSTFARCLNGLLIPQEGTVNVDGLSSSDAASLPAIRRNVGLVFQHPPRQMTSPTVERELAFGLENTGMAPGQMRVEVDNALAHLGFERHRHSSPGNLSGGEQQRLAVAAVMLLRPTYLILDEAASLLAGSARAELLDGLRETFRREHRCLITITHSPRDAESAERLVVLHQGVLVADGTPASVFSRPFRLRALGVPVPLRSLFAIPA